MKTSIVLTAFVVLVCVTTSCKKDYVCECKRTYTGSSSTTTTDDGSYTFKDSKVRARERCNKQEGTGSTPILGDYTRDCEIK